MNEPKFNRRRYERLPVDLTGLARAETGGGSIIRVANISRVGALLTGDRGLKSCLYQRKNRYTHRAEKGKLQFLLPASSELLVIQGVGIYMRQSGAGKIQVGFKFFQELSQEQFDALLESANEVHTQPEYAASVA